MRILLDLIGAWLEPLYVISAVRSSLGLDHEVLIVPVFLVWLLTLIESNWVESGLEVFTEFFSILVI